MRPSFKAFSCLVIAISVWLIANQARSRIKSTFIGEKIIELKTRRIQSELLDLKDHPLAGEYYAGDGLGFNLRLLVGAKEGFVLTSSGCVYLDRNIGSTSFKNDHLTLSSAFPADSSFPSELISVPWGPRHYLVPPTEMESFCEAVNKGREPRCNPHGSFLLREGDEKLRANSFPQVPQEYRQLLLKHKIDGTIVTIGGVTNRSSIDGIGFTDTRVTIDAGILDGLRNGMILYVAAPYRSDDSVEIISVGRDRSEAVVTQNGRPDEKPSVGWLTSTKPSRF
jgi:hypothetical protein